MLGPYYHKHFIINLVVYVAKYQHYRYSLIIIFSGCSYAVDGPLACRNIYNIHNSFAERKKGITALCAMESPRITIPKE